LQFLCMAKRNVLLRQRQPRIMLGLRREITIVENYLSGLSILSELYDDRHLVDFVEDFKNCDMYKQTFQKSVRLAELRKVPDDKILRQKSDIDAYFGGKK